MKSLIQWKPLDDEFIEFPLTLRKFNAEFAIDVYEENDNLIAKMNLPGLSPEDVDITLDENRLTIAGEREEEEETDEKDYYHKEIRRGSFTRSIRLPKPVDAENAVADYKDGVLTITIPTLEGEQEVGVKVPITQK